MRKSVIFILFVILIALFFVQSFSTNAWAEAPEVDCEGECHLTETTEGATEWLNSVSAELTKILADKTSTDKEKAAEIARVMKDKFYMFYIAYSSLGKRVFKSMEAKQKADFIEVFTQYLAHYYVKSIGKVDEFKLNTVEVHERARSTVHGEVKVGTDSYDLKALLVFIENKKSALYGKTLAYDLQSDGVSYLLTMMKTNFKALRKKSGESELSKQIDHVVQYMNCQMEKDTIQAAYCSDKEAFFTPEN